MRNPIPPIPPGIPVRSRCSRTQTDSSVYVATSTSRLRSSIRRSTPRKVESFPMEQMPPFSTAGLAKPTITYAGRLSDSRKGLELFFDALELFLSGKWTNPIAIWVIGGSAGDTRRARLSAASRPHLNQQLRSGALVFWGRIDHSSLPEFYSRSTLLVVPSFREQFGMDAVEAMMCGCAVAAARVGGLQDLVVHGRTGVLFERDNASALAECLVSYVASPQLPEWHGHNAALWARGRFDLRDLLPAFESVFAGAEPVRLMDYEQPAETAFVERSIVELTGIAERLMGRQSTGHTDLTSSQSISFRLHFKDDERVFVKQYSRRPRFLDTIHGENAAPAVHDPAAYRMALMRRLQGQRYVPEILHMADESGVIIQQWIEVTRRVTFQSAMEIVRELCGEISATALISDDDLEMFLIATTPLASMDPLTITCDLRRDFDNHAALLQSALHDGIVACRRM